MIISNQTKPWSDLKNQTSNGEVIALEQLTSRIEQAHSNRDPSRLLLYLACDKYRAHKLHKGDILGRTCHIKPDETLIWTCNTIKPDATLIGLWIKNLDPHFWMMGVFTAWGRLDTRFRFWKSHRETCNTDRMRQSREQNLLFSFDKYSRLGQIVKEATLALKVEWPLNPRLDCWPLDDVSGRAAW